MRLKTQALFAFIFLFLCLFNITTFGDERTRSYESKVLDSFDTDPLSRWIVRGSKFSAEGYPRSAIVKAWPESLFGKNKSDADLNCIGIMGSFDRKGYNYIEIIPAQLASDGTDEKEVIYNDKDGQQWIPAPITFPGRISSIDLWVWGSNYNYYIEVHVEDHYGGVHVLPLGDIQYTGWKNLTARVPSSIPQAEQYIPSLKRLKLVKFMIWTRPTERVAKFYVYIDHLKVLTDLFETRFDGDELEDPDFLESIWGTEDASAEAPAPVSE